MKALEAFNDALLWISVISSRRFENRPGAVIEKLPPKSREALQDLTAKELEEAGIEGYWIGSNEWYKEQDNKKLREDFDRKMKW